jgi:hypothetical protein
MADGHIVMPEHFLRIFMLVGMSQEGPYGQAKPCFVNTFDPTMPLSASEVSQQILRHTDHLDTHAAVMDSSTPPVFAFLLALNPIFAVLLLLVVANLPYVPIIPSNSSA